MKTMHDNWISIPKVAKDAKIRVFFFPFAGGGAGIYYQWAKDFPSNIEVCCVNLAGREKRFLEKAESNFSNLISDLYRAILPYTNKPFAFFGHSMGALISYELAILFRKNSNILPSCLFLSARSAPHIKHNQEHIHNLPDDLFVERLHKRYNGIPSVIMSEKDLLNLFLPTLRADIKMVELHEHKEKEALSCPIVAFCGSEDNIATKENVSSWKDYTLSNFDIEIIEGDHFFINTSKSIIINKIISTIDNILL